MRVFVVAEAGVNHLGDRAKMLALCDAAKAAGADAVKFQAYDVDKLAERRGYYDWSRDWGEVGDGTPQPKPEHAETVALLEESQLTDADLDAIAAHCKAIGIKWFASVFDPSQVERVLSRGAVALKVGHAEVGYAELLEACEEHAHNVKCYISDVADSDFSYSYDWVPVLCCPKYPADGQPPSMLCIPTAYQGFSSHWQDYRIPAAAALRGAEYIEAHLKLGRTVFGPTKEIEPGLTIWEDHETTSEPEAAWSLSPDDFARMVKLIREYETWL